MLIIINKFAHNSHSSFNGECDGRPGGGGRDDI